MPMTKEPSLVFEELLDRIGGDREFAVEILQEWVGTLQSELKELKEILDKNDPVRLRSKAHALKGTAANMAAREFARLAMICEKAAQDQNLEEARSVLPLLNDEAETLESAVDSLS
jgi:HPt (histidine-containing phosphotransfer) domain-containing protein